MFQICLILFEYTYEICIVSYKLFRNSRISLSQVEAVNILMYSFSKVVSHNVLIFQNEVIKNYY